MAVRGYRLIDHEVDELRIVVIVAGDADQGGAALEAAAGEELQVERHLDAVGARPKLALLLGAGADLVGDQFGNAGGGSGVEAGGWLGRAGIGGVRLDALEEIVADPRGQRTIPQVVASGADTRVLLAVGPEGGWNEFELSLLESHGFQRASMGSRTLRTDTACIALLALAGQSISTGATNPSEDVRHTEAPRH